MAKSFNPDAATPKKDPSVGDELQDLLGSGSDEKDADKEEEDGDEEEEGDVDDDEEEGDKDEEGSEEDADEDAEEGEDDEDEDGDEDDDSEGTEDGEGDEDEEDEEDDELARLRAENAELKAAKDLEDAEEEEEADDELDIPTFDDLIETDEAYEELLNSREDFNKLLKEFAAKVYESAVRGSMVRVQPIVHKVVAEETAQQSTVREFYRSNPELTAHKRYVAYVFSQQQAKSPQASYTDLLAATAEQARRDLRLDKGKAAGRKGGKRRSHVAPGSRSGKRGPSRSSSNKDDVGSQVQDLLL